MFERHTYLLPELRCQPSRPPSVPIERQTAVQARDGWFWLLRYYVYIIINMEFVVGLNWAKNALLRATRYTQARTSRKYEELMM